MIISHRHKFVYLKARKVAGTSVEVALAKHCGEDDIVTPIGRFDARWDQDDYHHPGTKREGYSRHATLVPVRRQLGRELWDAYFKFSIVRNPWDLVVSQYHWGTRSDYWRTYKGSVRASLSRFWTNSPRVWRNIRGLGESVMRTLLRMEEVPFDFFVKHMLRYYKPNNEPFYFDGSGSMGLDFVIRYENLANDYATVCERIGIPPSELPELKTKSRGERRHYSTYYDDRTREIVAKAYRRHVDHFGYRFNGP
jgi:hypothetical protein